jgi:hypothetical protein
MALETHFRGISKGTLFKEGGYLSLDKQKTLLG